METLKKYLSFCYSYIPLIDDLKDYKLCIVTPAGVITGSPIAKDDSDESVKSLVTLSSEYVEEYRKENSLDPSKPLDGNDGFFMLKNATLRSGGATYNFNFLNVFFDQIIAITVGKMD
ncbi:MAG: hypothetical protein J1F42_01830 [Lachnospiraceae bacterium]|nr:hypothetical protein [Lachnospiraceae bacterium]